MPAWKQLSDTELAAVMTFAKNSWSNATQQIVQPPKWSLPVSERSNPEY
jgi:hypothetical protein